MKTNLALPHVRAKVVNRHDRIASVRLRARWPHLLVPGGHTLHVNDPVGEKLPGAQGVHAAAPLNEKVPPGQGMQVSLSVAPIAGL